MSYPDIFVATVILTLTLKKKPLSVLMSREIIEIAYVNGTSV